jgi:putative transposase
VHHELVLKGKSSRRCCRLLGISPVHVRAPEPVENDALTAHIRQLAYAHKRYGYRRIWALLRREGMQVNLKRVKRIWRKEGLQVRKKQRRKRKAGVTVLIPQKAMSPNHVWTVDFVHDRLSRGGNLRLLTVVDEFTRECLSIRVERSLKSEDVRQTLDVLFRDYGRPLYLRSDNGSEFIAHCLQSWLADHGTKPLFIEPGSPWQNGKCESFNGKLRDECLNMEWFDTLKEAQVVIEAWRHEYNHFRPHSALNYQTPDAFAQATKALRAPNEGATPDQLPQGALTAFSIQQGESC